MSLLLDALKQAALDKKQQDILAAGNTSSDDQAASNMLTESLSRLNKKSEVAPTAGIELSLDEVTFIEKTPIIDELDDQKNKESVHEEKYSLLVQRDDALDTKPDTENNDSALLSGNDHGYGNVELFGGEGSASENSSQLNVEVVDRQVDALAVEQKDQQFIEEQEKNVARLIEASNKVYKKSQWKFYGVYMVLSTLVLLGLFYYYVNLPSVGSVDVMDIDEKFPEAVSREVIESLVNKSIAVSQNGRSKLPDKIAEIPIAQDNTKRLAAQAIINLKQEANANTPAPVVTSNEGGGDVIEQAESLLIKKQGINGKPVEEPSSLITEDTIGLNQPKENVDKPSDSVIVHSETSNAIGQEIAEAYGYYQAGNLIDAEKLYQRVITQSPFQKDALLGMAAISARNNFPKKSLLYYQQVLNIDPNNYYAKAGMLSLQANAIEDPQWLAELNELLYQQPDSPHLNFLKANVFALKNQWQAAQDGYFKAWSKEPNNPDYTFNLAVSLDQLQQSTQALDFYQKAYALAQNLPHNLDVRILLERIEQLKGGLGDATR